MENAISSSSFDSVMTAITSQISVSTVVEVVAVVTGACVGFAFMWWGVRFLKAKLMKAAKSGRI